jgi:LysR family transcriptional regulator, glycine cleavage system transcriptional activator
MESMRLGHTSDVVMGHRHSPPLHALTFFAVAARCGSFSRAAGELFVTQSAVSRQIQNLEEYLGAAVFVRHKRGLTLTAEGETLLPAVNDALMQLREICDRVRTAGQVLTLRMPPTFAARWFLPRLPSLQAFMPEVEVRVSTFHGWGPHFEDADIDAAIVQGTGPWDGTTAHRVMDERLTPLCSPAIAAQLRTPRDILSHPLLRCYPVGAWERWFERVGVKPDKRIKGQIFDTIDMSVSAAIRGQGIALGDLGLAMESLNDGVLIAPFEDVVDDGPPYCLVYSNQRAAQSKIQALRQWLELQGS